MCPGLLGGDDAVLCCIFIFGYVESLCCTCIVPTVFFRVENDNKKNELIFLYREDFDFLGSGNAGSLSKMEIHVFYGVGLGCACWLRNISLFIYWVPSPDIIGIHAGKLPFIIGKGHIIEDLFDL